MIYLWATLLFILKRLLSKWLLRIRRMPNTRKGHNIKQISSHLTVSITKKVFYKAKSYSKIVKKLRKKWKLRKTISINYQLMIKLSSSRDSMLINRNSSWIVFLKIRKNSTFSNKCRMEQGKSSLNKWWITSTNLTLPPKNTFWRTWAKKTRRSFSITNRNKKKRKKKKIKFLKNMMKWR